VKAKTSNSRKAPGKPEASDIACFAFAVFVAVAASFALHLFPAETVFVFFVLLLLIGLITALTHHPHP